MVSSMYALLSSSLLFSLALGSPLIPRAPSMLVHENLESVPNGFVHSGAPPPDKQLTLRIALAQSNTSGLVDELYAVSDPKSARYGKHLSKDEVEKYVAPTKASADAVSAWLKGAGLTSSVSSPAGDWLTIQLPVSQANQLLNADFSVYNHTGTGKQTIRTLNYSIPQALKGHLDLVHPTVSFPDPFAQLPVIVSPKILANATSASVPSACSGGITPACLQSIYAIPSTLATQASNQLGVSGFLDQFANTADLNTFLTQFRPDLSSATNFTVQTLDGGKNLQNVAPGTEANLDIQYTIGVASGVPTTFISVGNNFQDGDLDGFLDIINHLLNQDSPPQVLTTSYGLDEASISQPLAAKLCDAYMQLGARGVSVLFASGDGGVAGSQSQACTSFIPTFPSGCPYLTSVGATQLNSTGESAAPFSAGGFSNYFSMPSYQTAAVNGYVRQMPSDITSKFNGSGRAFPDVSALGHQVPIVVSGQVETVDGTSCSSPIFASVVALLNDGLAQAGKPPLGFLNPRLYSDLGAALNDVTSGSNPGCGTGGFPAASGWDPVTGLGTPNYVKLKAALGL